MIFDCANCLVIVYLRTLEGKLVVRYNIKLQSLVPLGSCSETNDRRKGIKLAWNIFRVSMQGLFYQIFSGAAI